MSYPNCKICTISQPPKSIPKNLNEHRRVFIKTIAMLAAHSSLFGSRWDTIIAGEPVLASPSTLGKLRIRISDFPALLSEFGSVRLGVNPSNGTQGPDGAFYPIVINRGANNQYYALNSRCTHSSCIVDPLDSSGQVVCPCHGSVFAIDGKRLSGPASSALSKYAIRVEGEKILEIDVPNLGFSLSGSVVPPDQAPSPRFRIDFQAFRNVEYAIQVRQSLSDVGLPAKFSETPEGALDQEIYLAKKKSIVSLYVERARIGFYSVALHVSEV